MSVEQLLGDREDANSVWIHFLGIEKGNVDEILAEYYCARAEGGSWPEMGTLRE